MEPERQVFKKADQGGGGKKTGQGERCPEGPPEIFPDKQCAGEKDAAFNAARQGTCAFGQPRMIGAQAAEGDDLSECRFAAHARAVVSEYALGLMFSAGICCSPFEPVRNLILLQDFGIIGARANDGIIIACDEHFRYERPRIVG